MLMGAERQTICLLLTVTAVGAALRLESRWWMNAAELDANLRLIRTHRASITGLYANHIGLTVTDDGSFSTYYDDEWLSSHTQPYLDLGLTVMPVLSLADPAVKSGAAKRSVAQVTEVVQRHVSCRSPRPRALAATTLTAGLRRPLPELDGLHHRLRA